jgi:hypothetical protein
MSIGCLSTQNVDAKIKPKLIFLNTRLCRQKRMINLREFYSYPTDNGSRQAAGELKAPVMTGSGAIQPWEREQSNAYSCPNAVIQVGAKECLSWGEKAEVGRHGTSYPIL